MFSTFLYLGRNGAGKLTILYFNNKNWLLKSFRGTLAERSDLNTTDKLFKVSKLKSLPVFWHLDPLFFLVRVWNGLQVLCSVPTEFSQFSPQIRDRQHTLHRP